MLHFQPFAFFAAAESERAAPTVSFVPQARRPWRRRPLPRRHPPDPTEALMGMTSLPEVLFVCVHNAGRSQMAAALLNHRAQGAVRVRSAGSEPADSLNPAVVEAMSEIGLDISENSPSRSPTNSCPQPTWSSPWVRRCLSVLPGKAIPGLGARRPGRQAARRGPEDSRRDRPPRAGTPDGALGFLDLHHRLERGDALLDRGCVSKRRCVKPP